MPASTRKTKLATPKKDNANANNNKAVNTTTTTPSKTKSQTKSRKSAASASKMDSQRVLQTPDNVRPKQREAKSTTTKATKGKSKAPGAAGTPDRTKPKAALTPRSMRTRRSLSAASKDDDAMDVDAPASISPKAQPPATPKSPSSTKKAKTPKSAAMKESKSSATKSPKKKTSTKEDASNEKPAKKRRRSKSKEPTTTAAAPLAVQESVKTAAPVITKSPNTVEKYKPKKIPKTMDMQVHRLRHLDYRPQEVLAMSACQNGSGGLALARADGSYELQQVSTVEEYRNHFAPHVYPLAHIAGSPLAVAHSLCWVGSVNANSNKKQTCVAAGPDGTLWIVNFGQSQLQSRINSGGGGIFDLQTCRTASTNEPQSQLPLVAAACQDGSIRIWQVASSNKTTRIQEVPITTLPNAGSAILSLTWQCVKQQGNTYETVLFAGVADGTIRKYRIVFLATSSPLDEDDDEDAVITVQQQTPLFRMTVENRGRMTATKVWTMQCLQDGETLVTGNSLGQVQFWNSLTGTLQQSMNQTELKADVLQLVVNQEETKVFASGVDSRVVCLERRTAKDMTWRFTTAQRPHTHDVKAMALIPSCSAGENGNVRKHLETLTTAGVDTKLCSYVVSDFSKRRPQVWYPWPSNSPISACPKSSIVSMQRSDQVELYRLERGGDKTAPPPSSKSSSQLIGEICIETGTNLVTSALSPNGQWLTLSNAASLFVFRLEVSEDDNTVIPQKVVLPKTLERLCVVAVHFHEHTLVVADSSNTLYVINLESETLEYSVISIPTEKGKEQLPVHSIHTSDDGSYLVTLSKLAENGVHIFKRKGAASAYHHYWTIPGLAGARPAALTLISSKNQLAVATFTNRVYIFDLEQPKLTPWSEQHGFPIQKWPMELMNRKEFPVRLTVNPANPTQLVLASFGSFVVMNLKELMPKYCRMVPETHVRRRKRQREDDPSSKDSSTKTIFLQAEHNRYRQQRAQQQRNEDPKSRSCTVCLHYNSMLYLDYLGPNEMVVVEQPWLRVISTFPEAIQRRVYGVN